MRKVAILGPESTGKSALCKALSEHYPNAVAVPEYARTYLEKNGPGYNIDTLDIIALEQFNQIQHAIARKPQWVFADTEMIVMKIWSEFVFAKVSEKIMECVAKQEFDLYLLCDIDLDWEEDILREHPDKRDTLFALYVSELNLRQLHYRVVCGQGENRVKNAIEAIEDFFGN